MAPTQPATTSLTTISEQTTLSPGTPSAKGGCIGGCIAGIIVGFLFLLVLVVVVIVIVVCYWSKTRKSGEMNVLLHQMELQSTEVELNTNDGEEDLIANIPESSPTSGTIKLGPVYEDPDAFKVDPHTQDNLAYGHVQQSAQLKGPIYEDIKPDPAYGYVQFN